MQEELILQNVRRYVDLGPAEEQLLLRQLHRRTLRKKEYLLRQGEVDNYSAFVTSGCLRSYSLDSNGFEHIVQFAPAGWWIADLQSVITSQPAKLNIDALEDSEMLLLYRKDQEELFRQAPVFERFFRILIENSVAAQHSRLMDYLGLSAQERYEGFCQRYPMLMQSLPQKQIASYIGVTPEFLSKLRRKRVSK